MRNYFIHLKKYIFRGIIAIIPIILILLVFRFFYIAIDRRILNLMDRYIGFRIPGLGFVIFLAGIYVIGLFASNIVGKWFFNSIEKISQKIPLIGSTYQVGKQISGALSLPEKQVFKKVVLVDYLKPGIYTIGFVTGKIKSQKTDEILLKIFIPTPPNPISGTMVIVNEKNVHDPGWTVEEGIQAVISGGIIGPETVNGI